MSSYVTPLSVSGDTVYGVLGINLAIGAVSWLQLVFVMNKFNGVCRFSRNDLWGMLLCLQGGIVRWIASLSLLTSSVSFQLATALVASGISWASLFVVFNDGFGLPTRQQVVSLGMALLVTALWEVNNRLVVEGV